MHAWGLLAAALTTTAMAADPIATPQAATEAARRYTKAICTERKPCRYRAEPQGPREWRVWVHQGKSTEPRVILFFDREGNLVRRIQGE